MPSQPAAEPQAARSPGYAAHPGYKVTFEPCAKRVRVVFNGVTLADSVGVRLLHETRHLPVYYFPPEDVRFEHLTPTEHGSFCPFKGDASYWTVDAGGRRAENAAWSYPTPFAEVAEIKDHVGFYWEKMDHWYEEDEEVFVHARDPHVRIDILESRRPVVVRLGGRIVAESRRALFLFETGLPTRYYLPREDVRGELLRPSQSSSACPYKGTASYYSVRIEGELFEDVVWTYADPLAECDRVKDHLCFFNERVESISVDGEIQPKPHTKWSAETG